MHTRPNSFPRFKQNMFIFQVSINRGFVDDLIQYSNSLGRYQSSEMLLSAGVISRRSPPLTSRLSRQLSSHLIAVAEQI